MEIKYQLRYLFSLRGSGVRGKPPRVSFGGFYHFVRSIVQIVETAAIVEVVKIVKTVKLISDFTAFGRRRDWRSGETKTRRRLAVFLAASPYLRVTVSPRPASFLPTSADALCWAKDRTS